MKGNSQIRKIITAFLICVVLQIFVMLAAMGFFEAKANSEYALNGAERQYVTAPFYDGGEK